MKSPFPLLYIEWCDAHINTAGWLSIDEVRAWARGSDWIIRQTGYLLEETKEYIVLAGKWNPRQDTEQQFAEITKIPRTWIRKRKRIAISSSSRVSSPSR